MLTFNLKKEWFEKIKSGEKTHEYREVKPYWTTRLNNFVYENFPASLIVEFKKGYSKEKGLYARIINISKTNGKHTELLHFLSCNSLKKSSYTAPLSTSSVLDLY